jgi:lysyl-tRNA synthetase class 2
LGLRVHERHLGAVAIVGAVAAAVTGEIGAGTALVVALLGAWLVVNDVPFVAALATAAVGTVDLLSAVTPNIRWRGRELVHLEPVSVMKNAHALAVPASIALIVAAYYLYRRRRAALHLAVALLSALAFFDLLKGLDLEEAAVTAACAALLVAHRRSFTGRSEPGSVRSALLLVPMLALATFTVSLAVVGMAAPRSASTPAILRETADLLLWQPGPFGFRDELARTGLAVELVSILALLAAAYLLFRPLAAPRDLPDAELRGDAERIVREHGSDTLSFFKLRADKHYLFDEGRSAFLGYRVESGVLVVSGDPVGEPAAVARLVQGVVGFAEERSLRLAALGVSEAGRRVFAQAGLRALYVGDEAIVDTAGFSLDGRAIRKVRQSVSRLEKEGYDARLVELGSLDPGTLTELETVAAHWLDGAPERGFSMAMDSLRNPCCSATLVLVARDEHGAVGGFLHFVPTYGRGAVSLSLMRRRQDTPNGTTEFMIVKAIELLRERGIGEVSLNFAAFARLLREPDGRLERAAGRAITFGDTWFQIERLYRFNAKFFPRWEPRYFMYEHRLGLPRAGIAALWLEGQLPKPGRRALERAA